MIFVFGSNKAGIHGAGAAKYAHKFMNAQWGIGEGPTGVCYALPTKGYKIEKISLKEIQKSVDNFLIYAIKHPTVIFQVTQVGCGLGGYISENIAPLFNKAPENCLFDEDWKPFLSGKRQFWGSI